ncbi:glutamine-hydrolyzing carbamoyl-phosphate synthase small subunit [Patescibacteria group bacterium]|nr:glutamine-hydrolyzing carbamoyl-phosphate synthase small subunit [Patescibacteria group bacterium]
MKKILTLADGSAIAGDSFGAHSTGSTSSLQASSGQAVEAEGEVVFATGMVGYPESLTDPSFAGQILVLTYPLIGNYGVPKHETWNMEHGTKVLKNFESEKIQIAGLVVSEYSEKYSHHAAKESLAAWLQRENIPAITGVDTRSLTQKLREQGTILGRIENRGQRVEGRGQKSDVGGQKFYDPNKEHLVARVSPTKPRFFKRGKKTVAILDCGMKLGILRSFLERGISVHHLPHDFNLEKVKFDGLFISNGPGDPARAVEAIHSIRQQLKKSKPIFGICLGNQLLALAAGMQTFKLPYGHRSQNQPVREIKTGRCFITSQNHGFAVRNKMKAGWEVAFENLNDGSIEGLRHRSKPFFSVQFHPEASPGPTDTEFLFDEFIAKL